MKWNFGTHDQRAVESLVEQFKISPVVAQLLLNRGIAKELIPAFLHAKLTDLRVPEELPGLSEAAAHIMAAIEAQEDILIYGDYDADGMTATAILYRCLKLIGGRVSYHLPNRMEEGYGLHPESVEKFVSHGKKLIITVDCGIANVAAAARARELDVKLIVTDHHRFGDELPDATAIVHPDLPGHNYPFAGLCGAGVAFKLAWCLCQLHCGASKVNAQLRDFLLQAVGLATIGTIADVVPLIDENRIIVRNGLKTLLANHTIGVRKLLELAKLGDKKSLDAEDIGFMLAPRLNAAGRLGQAQLGVELLVTEDEERAEALARYIDELNGNRNKIERSIHIAAGKQLKEVHAIDDDPAFVLASPNWHPGVIGIVAGKLAEKHHKPVVLVALDKLGTKPGIGSARSPNGVNLHQAFQDCEQWLVSGGGHAAAAGLKIEEKNLSAFRTTFLEVCAEQSAELDTETQLRLDAEATLDLLNYPAVQQIEKLAPFGMGNHKPVFCAMGVHIVGEPKLMGESGRHMSFRVRQYEKQLRVVAFGQAEEWLPKLTKLESAKIDIAFRPVLNDFGGFPRVELQLIDWRPAQTDAQAEHRESAVPEPHLTKRPQEQEAPG